MREILFRGKRTDFNRWIEGYLYRLSEKLNPFIMIKNNGGMAFEVIPETVGQYTGLTDKNGMKIFEGDIVQIEDFTHGCALNYKQPTSNWVVHWREDTARFCIDYMSYLPFDFTETEIIGNIYDNPELLKGAE